MRDEVELEVQCYDLLSNARTIICRLLRLFLIIPFSITPCYLLRGLPAPFLAPPARCPTSICAPVGLLHGFTVFSPLCPADQGMTGVFWYHSYTVSRGSAEQFKLLI